MRGELIRARFIFLMRLIFEDSAYLTKMVVPYNWLSVIMAIKLHKCDHIAVILLHAHPASFAHNFVSAMQSFYFPESQDAIVLQICH